MAGLRCCASHGGIISIEGLAANSRSPWILQAPNLHFGDVVVNFCYECYCISINVSNVKTYLYPSIKFKLFQENDRPLGRFSFALMLKTCPRMCTCH